MPWYRENMNVVEKEGATKRKGENKQALWHQKDASMTKLFEPKTCFGNDGQSFMNLKSVLMMMMMGKVIED